MSELSSSGLITIRTSRYEHTVSNYKRCEVLLIVAKIFAVFVDEFDDDVDIDDFNWLLEKI